MESMSNIDVLIAASAGSDTTFLTFDSDHVLVSQLFSHHDTIVVYLGKG